MSLPIEKISGVESVGAQLKEATELSRGGGGPEREFLHKRGLLLCDQGFEFFVKGRKVRVRGDAVERGVVAIVALIFPNVDCFIECRVSQCVPG